MEPDKKIGLNEKSVLIWQYGALFLAIILFLPLSYLITIKYSLLVSIAIESFISISSIINRVSIFRRRGQLGHSRGSEAVVLGVILLIGALITIVIILRLPADSFPF